MLDVWTRQYVGRTASALCSTSVAPELDTLRGLSQSIPETRAPGLDSRRMAEDPAVRGWKTNVQLYVVSEWSRNASRD